MSSKLIIIRGNSGSGKSTVARQLRERLGDNTMLVPQDVIRREILFVKDREGNPAIDLIANVVSYAKKIDYNVILEGILSKKLYESTLNQLIDEFAPNIHIFYMDVSFEETVRRHQTKPNKHEYGEEKMREWWIEKDYLGHPSEKIIPETLTTDEAVEFILNTIS